MSNSPNPNKKTTPAVRRFQTADYVLMLFAVVIMTVLLINLSQLHSVAGAPASTVQVETPGDYGSMPMGTPTPTAPPSRSDY